MYIAPPLGVQLWTLRDELVADAPSTLEQVATLGYIGVEAVLLPGLDARRLRGLCDAVELEILAAHLPLPVGDQASESLDNALTLGVHDLIVTPGPDRWETPEEIQRYADEVNTGLGAAADAGLRLGYHNHDWEFAQLDGIGLAYDLFLGLVDPALVLEVDLYWAAVAGQELPTLMTSLGARCEFVHVKDGPLSPPEPNTAVGDGVVDLTSALRAATSSRWHIVELDSFAGAPLEALRRSANHLAASGLSRARAHA